MKATESWASGGGCPGRSSHGKSSSVNDEFEGVRRRNYGDIRH